MAKIIFIKNSKSYLPELYAYKEYIKNYTSHTAIDISYDQIEEVDDHRPDVIWKFPGIDFRRKTKSFLLHEYGSLSTPPLSKIKNIIKGKLNVCPNGRIFLNEFVKNELDFKDSCPFFFRDMGINKKFFKKNEVKPQYEFVYCGSIYRGKFILNFLEDFLNKKMQGKILVIGGVKPHDEKRLGQSGQIIFTGKLNHDEVANTIQLGKYGLNLIPDIYPYNQQTSTKVLEYAALGLPIISTQYYWIESFINKRGGSIYWLKNIDSLCLKKLNEFNFKNIYVENLDWDNVIHRSEIFSFL